MSTEEESVNSSQPLAAGCTASIAIGCMCSPAVARRNPGFVCCALCSKQVLFACLMHQFVQSGGSASKNSIEWHIAFISQCGLRYMCKACSESELVLQTGNSLTSSLGLSNESDVRSMSSLGNTLKPNSGNSHIQVDVAAVDSLTALITHMDKKLEQFRIELLAQSAAPCSINDLSSKSSYAGAVSRDLTSNIINSADNSSSDVKSKSFSEAISSNLSDVVKSAMVETIRHHEATQRDGASVAIHNLKEFGSDVNDVRELLDFIGCNAKIIRIVRIGQQVKASKKCRLLKVELQSTSDKDMMLQLAKYLREDPTTRDIFITPWLRPEELSKLKKLQEQCRILNEKSPKLKGGWKRFIIISGKLMERLANGKLKIVREKKDGESDQSTSRLDDIRLHMSSAINLSVPTISVNSKNA